MASRTAGRPTPNQLKSVEVQNKSDKRVTVTVTYKNGRDSKPGESKPPVIKLSADIVPGKAFFFPSLSIDMGGWEAIAPVLSVAVGDTTKVISVIGIVNKQIWLITADGELKQQEQGK